MKNNFGVIFGAALGIFLAVVVALNILSEDNSNIASLAKYLSFGSFLIGIFSGRFGLYILAFYAAVSDLIKRSLIMEGAFSFIDITYILMMSPVLMFGIFVGCGLKLFWGQVKLDRLQMQAFGVGFVLGAINFLVNFSGGGLFPLLQALANSFSYFFLPFCMLVLLVTREQYQTLLRFLLVLFSGVAIWACRQSFLGFTDFEIGYLFSGFTSVANVLNPEATRPMSTLSSPGALAYCCGALGAAVWVLSIGRGKKDSRAFPWAVGLLVGALLYFGAAMSQSRTMMLLTFAIVPLYLLFARKITTILCYFLAIAGVATAIFSAGTILDKGLIKNYQVKIVPQIVKITGLDSRYLTLATMSVRLEGWRNIAEDKEFQRPFGSSKVRGLRKNLSRTQLRQQGFAAHDALSTFLIKFGYVPLALVAVILTAILWRTHRFILGLDRRSNLFRASRLGLVAVGAGFFGGFAGGALAAYPVALIMNFLFSALFVELAAANVRARQPSPASTSEGEFTTDTVTLHPA